MNDIEIGVGYEKLNSGAALLPGDEYYFLGVWTETLGGSGIHKDAVVDGPGFETTDGPYRRWVADGEKPKANTPQDAVLQALTGNWFGKGIPSDA